MIDDDAVLMSLEGWQDGTGQDFLASADQTLRV